MPDDIFIEQVTDSRGLDAFVAMPGPVYAGDAAYVPPLHAWVKRRLLGGRPFAPDGKLKLFVARRGTGIVGRIAFLRDKSHEKHQDEPVGFFGYFETIDDRAVASALLDRASDEARACGLEQVRGPRSLTRIEEIGLVVEGGDRRSPMLAGHSPAYYVDLVEGAGFTKQHDVLAYEIPVVDEHGNQTPIPEKMARKADAVDIPGLEVRSVQWRHFRRDLRLIHEVFVDAFRKVPENTPMPRAQFVNLGSAFMLFSNRHMLQVATVDGKAAGFALCFPELNEAVARAEGHLLPLGGARFLRGLRHLRTASFKLLGVMPEYRSSGLHALMIREAVEGIRRAGYQRLEASLVDERNKASRGVVEGAGMTPYKRFRVYQRDL